jgi:hypothetical protein
MRQNLAEMSSQFKRKIPPVCLSVSSLNQIDVYRSALQTTTGIYGGKGPVQPPSRAKVALRYPTPTVLDDYSSGTEGLVVVEDVDDDAQDQDCSFQDELALFADTDSSWVDKFRREEKRVRELRLASLDHWRRTVAP